MNKYYTYCCPICRYQGNSITYFNNRTNPDQHKCFPLKITEDLKKYNLKREDFENKSM